MPQHHLPVQTRCEVILRADSVIWLALSGELDLAFSSSARLALERAQSEASLVIVDLARVEFMDSTGVHMLLEAQARARRDGTRLVVASPSAVVRRLLDLTGTVDRLTVDDRPPATFAGARQ